MSAGLTISNTSAIVLFRWNASGVLTYVEPDLLKYLGEAGARHVASLTKQCADLRQEVETLRAELAALRTRFEGVV